MRFDPEKLKAIRLAAGLRNVRVAAVAMFKQTDIDVSDRAWRNWEDGVSEPTSANLAALSVFFGVAIDDFFSTECGHVDATSRKGAAA